MVEEHTILKNINKKTKAELVRIFFRENLGSLMLAIFFGLLLYFIYAEASSQYRWQWNRIWRYIGVFSENGFKAGPLLEGLYLTLLLILNSLILAIIFGFILCYAKLSLSPVARLVSSQIISIIRNTPLLIQLFLFYYVFAPIFNLSNFSSAVLTLALFEGSYLAEIFRGGIVSIPKTQWESAFSLGMTTSNTLSIVIIPQALRNILPSFSGQLISLIKDTSLVSAIAVADLTQKARALISETFLSFETWLLVALFYFILTAFVSIPAYIYQRVKINKI